MVVCLVAVFGATLWSCAAPPIQQTEGAPERLVWPQPPAPPRITFIRDIQLPRDIQRDKGLWSRLKEIFAGRTEVQIVRGYGLKVDDAENLIVADPGAHVVHILNLDDGKYRSLPHRKDGLVLLSPIDADVNADGKIFVSDSAAGLVYIFGPEGRLEGSFGEFIRPTGLALNQAVGRLYVVDTMAHRIRVHRTDGTHLFDFGERGVDPGEFNFPTNICLDREGNVYITDSLNFRVQVLDPDGKFLYAFGEPGDGPGSFAKARGIGVDSDGNIYVADAIFDNIQIFDSTGRTLLYFGFPGRGRGEFYLPAGLEINRQDQIYVVDSYNHRVQVFEYLKEEVPVTEEAEIPASLLMLSFEEGSAFLLEKVSQTLFHYRQTHEGIRLAGSYPWEFVKSLSPGAGPSTDLPREGVYFQAEEGGAGFPGIQLESLPLQQDEQSSPLHILVRGDALSPVGAVLDDTVSLLMVEGDKSGALRREMVSPKTPFIVLEEMSYLDETLTLEDQADILGFLNHWRYCWNNLDIDCYMDSYAMTFRHEAMDREGWRAYKKAIFDKREESQVTVRPLHILRSGPYVILTGIQSYRSPQYSDLGIKELVLKKEGEGWKIVMEEWRPYDERE
jgi:sugar lactone lactonase YvrE/ketosteroid isomerase-like protein